MILYIHGFASCGVGNKSTTLRNFFGEDKVLSPDLPPEPKRAIELLSDLIEKNNVKLLVGSSLGGYYAIHLAEKYDLKAVLINPALRPFESLNALVGKVKRYCDDTEFEWKREYIRQLFELFVPEVKLDRYLVLLQTRDELLNYQEAVNRFMGAKVIVEYGGNHRFENLDDYLYMIKNFMEK